MSTNAQVSWEGNTLHVTYPNRKVSVSYMRSGRALTPNKTDAPAHVTTYNDGRVIERWFVSGIAIPSKYIKYVQKPELITLETVLREKNVQRRMLWLKMAGAGKLLGSTDKLRCISEDVDNLGLPRRLFRFKVKDPRKFEWRNPLRTLATQLQAVAILEVHNSTPPHEPFALFVPSNLRNCEEAVAWTFPVEIVGFNYDPISEA